MNSQLLKARRQLDSFRADLTTFRSLVDATEEEGSKADIGTNRPTVVQGQTAASISILHQLLKDMDEMSNREMNMTKRQQYKEECKELAHQFSSLKQDFDALKKKWADKTQLKAREELLALPNGSAAGPGQAASPGSSQNPYSSSTPFYNSTASLNRTTAAVDGYIGIGLATLSDLQRQRGVMKGTRRRLLDAANSLGLSQSMIRWIETRSIQDMYIFYVGVLVTLVIIVLVLLYL